MKRAGTSDSATDDDRYDPVVGPDPDVVPENHRARLPEDDPNHDRRDARIRDLQRRIWGDNPYPQDGIADAPGDPRVTRFVSQLVCVNNGLVVFSYKWGPEDGGKTGSSPLNGERRDLPGSAILNASDAAQAAEAASAGGR